MGKILITGGAGYIGSNSAYYFLKKGYEIIILDNLSTGNIKAVQILKNKFKRKVRFYHLDLRDNLDLLFKKEKNIKAVLHYAGLLSIGDSFKNPGRYFSNNTCGTLNLLNYIVRFGIKIIIFSSTCAVYNESEKMPVNENSKAVPGSPYGESKLIAESIIKWYGLSFGLKYVIFRYFNVCGGLEDGSLGDLKYPSSLIQNAVISSLQKTTFYLTCKINKKYPKGSFRDFVDVNDISDAHYKAFLYLLNNRENRIINLGSETVTATIEILKKVEEKTGNKLKIKKGIVRKNEYQIMIASSSTAKKVLGWEPVKTISDSIDSTIMCNKAFLKEEYENKK